nr:MAG TPA: hypothetical protein [Caudoviricetes sp.]
MPKVPASGVWRSATVFPGPRCKTASGGRAGAERKSGRRRKFKRLNRSCCAPGCGKRGWSGWRPWPTTCSAAWSGR